MIDFKYRPDVDGLRAIAVTLVLLFHAGLGFSGGYIGVDVFFVISGFLITGLILKAQQADKFRLKDFWLRRIRRIIPASTAVVVVVLLIGFLVLLPSDYEDLGQSAVAQQLMLSNVHFWQSTGYFDGPAELKPLLHTWSLAVEEQFYIGYPFLLIGLHRLGPRKTFAILMAIAVVSLAASEYGTRRYPSPTFFLLPTRAWELLAGGLVCFLAKPTRLPRWLLSLMSWGSLLAILATGWLYTASTPFPGFSALIPCGATAVFIYANSLELSFPARLLATKPIVFVGLISYSLYLWHWPVLAFARYWSLLDGAIAGVVSLLVSFLLGFLSWKYIETPFRRPKVENAAESVGEKKGRVVRTAVASSLCLVAIALVAWLTNGIPQRLPEQARSLLQNDLRVPEHFSRNIQQLRMNDVPIVGPQPNELRFAVWGDSHALAISNLIHQLAVEHSVCGAIVANTGHPPLLDVYKPNRGARMKDWNKEAFDYLDRHQIRNVILVGRWSVLIEGQVNGEDDTLLVDDDTVRPTHEKARELFETSLSKTIRMLDRRGVRVWLMKQVPLQTADPIKTMVRSMVLADGTIPPGTTRSDYRDRHGRANQIIDNIARSFERVTVIAPEVVCFDQQAASRLGDSEGCFYADDDHLSPHGANTLLGSLFEPVFETIAVQREPEDN